MTHKILVVDDQALVRNHFQRTLEAEGFEVDVAENGKFGWKMALKETYSLILSDLNMPYINGIDMIKLIRKESLNMQTPAVMISSDATEDRKRIAKEAGANGWITKPVSAEQLIKLAKTVIR
jgi:two-component system, chemotaxis family, chemotaxis protein CheY